VTKSLETLMDNIGVLFKFHDKPMCYLYNTFHYYEALMRDRPKLKKTIVANIYGDKNYFLQCLKKSFHTEALKEVRPENWCFSSDFASFLESKDVEEEWQPKGDYYAKLVARMAGSLMGNKKITIR